MKDTMTGPKPLPGLEVILTLVTLLLVGLGLGVYWRLLRPKPPRRYAYFSEAKADLKGLYTSQKAWFQEKDRYTEKLGHVGFSPERGNRYTTFMRAVGPLQRRDDEALVEGGAYSIVSVDSHAWPEATVLTSFYMTGCPLTRVVTPDGRKLGLGVWDFQEGVPGFLAASAANLDEDPELDCWSISSVDRVSATGEHISAGQPFLEASDL